MTKRTFEGAAAAAAGAETEFGIFLPDIARDAGIPLAALEAEVTAKRLPTFEGSFECGDPREYWSAGPVEIAVWLARPATPGDLRDRIAAWNETVFTVAQREAAGRRAAELAIEDAVDELISLAGLAGQIGIPVERLEAEYDAGRLMESDHPDAAEMDNARIVSAVSVAGWLENQANQDPELRPAFAHWFEQLPEAVRGQATRWAFERTQSRRNLGIRGVSDAPSLSDAQAQALKRKRQAQKTARKANRRR